MNAAQLADGLALASCGNLRVMHDDGEWGLSVASLSLRKIVQMADFGDNGNLRELGYTYAYSEEAIAATRERVAAHATRDLKQEYAANQMHNEAMGWTPEDFVKMFEESYKTDVEMLRRIEEAEFAFVISGSDEK